MIGSREAAFTRASRFELSHKIIDSIVDSMILTDSKNKNSSLSIWCVIDCPSITRFDPSKRCISFKLKRSGRRRIFL